MMKPFCKNSSQLLASNYFPKKVPSQMFNWVLNTPLEFSLAIQLMSLFWEAAPILGLERIIWIIATSDWVSRNHTCCQLYNTITNILNKLCYKTLNFFSLSRYIYFFSDPTQLLKTARKPLCNWDSVDHTFYVAQW